MPTPPRMLTFDGQTRSVEEWAKLRGMSRDTLRARLNKLGWSVEKALAAPPDRKFRGGRKPKPAAGTAKPVPALKEHSSGQAYVRWYAGGEVHDRYFGVWGSAEAAKAYNRFAAEWVASGSVGPPPARGLFVADLITRFIIHVREYYRQDGEETGQVPSFVACLARLNALYGDIPAKEFGPTQLRAYRSTVIAEGLARVTVNQHQWRIRRMFRWAVSHELLPPAVSQALDTVENLQAGRTTAAEGEPVPPAEIADVEKSFPYLHRDPAVRAVFEAMVRVHHATGVRAGELCRMVPADIDRSGAEWLFTPKKHKNRWRGKRRRIWIGPRGQAVLGPLLDAVKPNELVFGYPRTKGGLRKGITVGLYTLRIREACRLAGVPPWRSHQLRHRKAQEVQDAYENDDMTGIAIGDSPEVARQIYTRHPEDAVARRIAAATG